MLTTPSEAHLSDWRGETSTEPYRIFAERKLRELVEQGYFDNLPGAGKPLDLSDEDNPFIPSDLRLAYRILRNAGVALPWIELGNEVESDLAELRRLADAQERFLRSALGRARRALPGLRAHRLSTLRAGQKAFDAKFGKMAADLNRKIDLFNIEVPVVNLQKPRFRPDLPLERLRALLVEFEAEEGN